VDETRTLSFGDLVLDETCLFARRNGLTIQFTRSERALLLALSRNPRRLMRRNRLLDEIAASESDSSDRNIDFLINRLRTKLGDSARSPKYIATQYGEGYVWVAEPLPAKPESAAPLTEPVDLFMAIVPALDLREHDFRGQALSLIVQLRDVVAASVGADRKIVIAENGRAPTDKLRCLLQVCFQAENRRLSCAATLREMPSKRIMKVFRLLLDIEDATSFTKEAARVANGVVNALQQTLAEASTGLGTPIDATPETRLKKATSLLVANLTWLERGKQLSIDREHDPANADTALQWCMHLFSRLVLTNPFKRLSLEDRDRIESDIEATVLDYLPAIESRPLLNLAGAKLLYFIGRGHIDLAEEIAERGFARTSDFAAGLQILAQLRGARGKFDEAVILYDRAIEMVEPGTHSMVHLVGLKCLALLAAGDRAALDATLAITDLTGVCPSEIELTLALVLAPADRQLPPALGQALASIGSDGAASAIEYAYFTSARQLTSERARANLMRGLVTHVTNLYGEQSIPPFVLASTGLTAAV
jgi:DNA-binding winged helix-turn-helix (wHTH) protein